MELAKSRDEKLAMVHEALHQLMEERKKKGKDKEEEDLLLSKLLLQLESLEKDAITTEGPKESAVKEDSVLSRPSGQGCEGKEVDMDEIARELRRVRRQNFITHCLLSVMIIITATWQFSEVSILLMVKEKVSHPLSTVGDVVKGFLKGKGNNPQIEAPPLPPIAVPDLPHMDLPSLTLKREE